MRSLHAARPILQLVTAQRDAYVAGFTLLAAMGRAEARDLNLFGGTLFEPGFSRPPASGPMLMEMNPALMPRGTIEFVPMPEEGRLPPTDRKSTRLNSSH